MNRPVVLLLTLLAINLPVLRAGFDGDFQTWGHLVAVHDTEDFQFVGLTQGRWIEDSSGLGTWVLDLMGYWKATEKFSLGAGYDFCRARSTPENPWVAVHMLNLDLRYRADLSERIGLQLRHRLEVRWQDNRNHKPYEVSRLLVGAGIRPTEAGALRQVGIATEPFFDYDRGELVENRFQPLILTFRLSDDTSLQTYGMVRSIRTADGDWLHAGILGLGLNTKL